MTVIEIRSHRWGWKVFESRGVEPVFPQKDQAIDYAQTRACFQTGEIRVLDSRNSVERIITFNESDRNCDLWDDEAKGAYRNDRKRACHDTLPWLISVLLDEAGVACSELH